MTHLSQRTEGGWQTICGKPGIPRNSLTVHANWIRLTKGKRCSMCWAVYQTFERQSRLDVRDFPQNPPRSD